MPPVPFSTAGTGRAYREAIHAAQRCQRLDRVTWKGPLKIWPPGPSGLPPLFPGWPASARPISPCSDGRLSLPRMIGHARPNRPRALQTEACPSVRCPAFFPVVAGKPAPSLPASRMTIANGLGELTVKIRGLKSKLS